ncbi:MAG: LysM peptidoglycan-binding domain-containing protein [Nitrospirae bacterium]|nr:LysM peptidoglycan-binding domain-containing protein [Nitrospirota bacterium]
MINPPESSNTALIFEAKTEAEELQAALASERIHTAKQAAEVRAARQETSALRDRGAEYIRRIASLKAELDTLKTERDQMRQENAELSGHVAGLPELPQLMQEVRTMKSSLNGMVASLKTLSAEVAQFKQGLGKQQIKAIAKAQKPASSKGELKAKTRRLPKTTISVKRGDSLWRIAQTHGTTVTNLKEINGLKSDRIIVGQQLRIPVTGTIGTKSDLAGLQKAHSRYAEADLFVLPQWRSENRR